MDSVRHFFDVLDYTTFRAFLYVLMVVRCYCSNQDRSWSAGCLILSFLGRQCLLDFPDGAVISHSYLRATIGSTRDALLAGIYPATAVTMSVAAIASAMLQGS